MVFLPGRRALLEPHCGIDLMQKKIAAVARADDCLRRRGVTGDHNAPVGGVKPVAVRKIPGAVCDGKSSHFDVGVLVDNARMNLMRVDVICLRVSVLQTVNANIHVFYISGLNVARHSCNAQRPVEFQRSGTALDGWTEVEVREAGCVVRMQVRGKDDLQVPGGERGDVLVTGGSGGATNHSRAEIDKISSAVYDDGN